MPNLSNKIRILHVLGLTLSNFFLPLTLSQICQLALCQICQTKTRILHFPGPTLADFFSTLTLSRNSHNVKDDLY